MKSKETADKVYNVIRSIYMELYGGEITESKTVTFTPKVYDVILMKCDEFGASADHVMKVMGFRDYELRISNFRKQKI